MLEDYTFHSYYLTQSITKIVTPLSANDWSIEESAQEKHNVFLITEGS